VGGCAPPAREDLCARDADPAPVRGRSTSPLERHIRARAPEILDPLFGSAVRLRQLARSSCSRLRLTLRRACGKQLRCKLSVLESRQRLRSSPYHFDRRRTPGRAPTRLLLGQKCDRASGPQGTQVPSFTAWARLTWRVCRLRLPQQSRTRTVAICGALSNHRLERTAGPAEMSKQRTSATSLSPAVLSPLAAQAHR